jgi:hypothetical protein
MKRHPELWKRPQSFEDLKTKRWISAYDCFDSLSICGFKIFDTSYLGIDKLSSCGNTDFWYLFHLQWRVIPCPGAQAPLKHQRSIHADRVS